MDRVMEGLTELAEFVAARYKDDPGGKHLQSVKRAEIEIERLRSALCPLSDIPAQAGEVRGSEAAIRKAGQVAVDGIIDGWSDRATLPQDDDLADYLTRIVDACVRAAAASEGSTDA